ncbi:MAG: AAA family ATPase [Bacilli bacterium]|nr:AAA family ATPase [Bacilli bacterium]
MLNSLLGVYDFKSLIKSGYYVDKTEFIEKIYKLGDGGACLLFTRPRRFGKSLMISCLDSFFSLKYDDADRYFKNLYIHSSPVYEERNKYPVIVLSFKDANALNAKDSYNKIFKTIDDLYDSFDEINDVSCLTESEKEIYTRIRNREGKVDDYLYSLYILTKLVHDHYKIKPFLFIDEYDAQINNAYQKNFLDEINNFFKNLYSNALKGNEHIRLCLLTGVLISSKESLSSGLNNIPFDNGVYSIFPKEYFGFTRDEVLKIKKDYGSQLNIDDISSWYGGYYFNNVETYNPWSVLSLFSSGEKFLYYWGGTGATKLLSDMLLSSELDFKSELQRLLNGETLSISPDYSFGYEAIEKSKQGLLTYLTSTGYLSATLDENNSMIDVKIPNLEVLNLIRKEILDKFNVSNSYLSNLTNFKKTFLEKDTKVIENFLSNLLSSLSYYSFKNEKVYQTLLNVLTSIVLSEYYVKEESNSGYGRSDLLMIPKNKKETGFIIEIKLIKARTTAERLKNAAEVGLNQIEKNEYYRVLEEQGITNYVCYGIAFQGKKVSVVYK